MNKTFLLPFYSRKSPSKVCKNFNIWSTTNQERPVLVHCKFIYQDFYGRPIWGNPEDSVGFRIPAVDFGFQSLNSGFRWRDSGFPGLNFGFQSPGFPHPQAKIFWIPQAKMETGFEKISRSTFCWPYMTYLPSAVVLKTWFHYSDYWWSCD